MPVDPKNNISFFPQKETTIVLSFSPDELIAVIHALEEDYDRIRASGGDWYGTLSLEKLRIMIDRLHSLYSQSKFIPAA